MKGGFSRRCVNPPLGSPIQGLGQRGGCKSIREDIHVQALHLSHSDQEAVIVGADLLFFDRPVIDRIKETAGRRIGICPERILFNVTHNHAGPPVGTWGYDHIPDSGYLDLVEEAIAGAVGEAKQARRDVTISGGMTRCRLPVSRRNLDDNGQAQWLPDPNGTVCDAVPVCLLKDASGGVVCVLFSASCHPSAWYELEICGGYPGVAAKLVNDHFNTEGALFLQGCGGDAKPCTVAREGRWQAGTWDDVETAGRLVAEPVIALVEAGLTEFLPEIRNDIMEMVWPLEPAPDDSELEAVRDESDREPRQLWAQEMLDWRKRVGKLPESVPVRLHALQIAKGLRLVGLEGEAVADLGNMILKSYDKGVTFPLGYTDGAQLYLPSDHMLSEHGYEVDSYWEYHWPSPMAAGIDARLEAALRQLQTNGRIPNE